MLLIVTACVQFQNKCDLIDKLVSSIHMDYIKEVNKLSKMNSHFAIK